MTWRAALWTFLGLLLPVPLVLLLSSVMLPSLQAPDPESARVSPVLNTEERTRRETYRRYCEHSSACEPPLGCFFDLRLATHYCTDSQCTADTQCAEDQVCRMLATVGGGPLVRFCTPVGVRQEGERCYGLPRDKASACGPGLLCGGNEGWCARTCTPGDAASCPEGFFCASVPPQPVCLPTCKARGCPEGQQCVSFEDGASACAEVYGPDCQQSSCPHGCTCEVLDSPRSPGKVWTSCVERCGEEHPPCSEGLICDGWRCMPPCTPESPSTCAEGYRCKQRRPTSPWVCEPDW
ncbi:hypothetical protein P2318_03890 [Myxococcaceae bacterium GXIMD 01537]